MTKAETTRNTSEDARNDSSMAEHVSGLSEKDIAIFERKMDNLTTYLCDLARKCNHSDEVVYMIQNGLMEVMDWFIPIRRRGKTKPEE